MSEMAGAPKFLLDCSGRRYIYIYFAVMSAYHDLQWASVHLLAIWSACTLLRAIWLPVFFVSTSLFSNFAMNFWHSCQGLIVHALICRQQSQVYCVVLLQQSWWRHLMVAGFLFLCWQLVWTLLVLSYITVRVQLLRCYEFSGVNLGRYASHLLAIMLSPPKCIV